MDEPIEKLSKEPGQIWWDPIHPVKIKTKPECSSCDDPNKILYDYACNTSHTYWNVSSINCPTHHYVLPIPDILNYEGKSRVRINMWSLGGEHNILRLTCYLGDFEVLFRELTKPLPNIP